MGLSVRQQLQRHRGGVRSCNSHVGHSTTGPPPRGDRPLLRTWKLMPSLLHRAHAAHRRHRQSTPQQL
eukprot:4393-Eustigmatos_ZCMA.PRE.1